MKTFTNKTINFSFIAILILFVYACSSSDRHSSAELYPYDSYESSYSEDSEAPRTRAAELNRSVSGTLSEDVEEAPQQEVFTSSAAAVENLSDTARRMIRTAELKFKVKDVIKSTYSIEDIIVSNGGFVENSRLASRINRRREITTKVDSTMIITYYTVINELVLRVPNIELDKTLKEIAHLVDFLDYRNISARDVTLNLLSKRLEQNRLARYDSRMTAAVDNQGRQIRDISNAEDNILRRQIQADEAMLANMRTLDMINFSTIKISLYQNQSIKYETIAIEKKIKTYSAPFGVLFVDALKFGWSIAIEIFLFLINIWTIIALFVLIFFGIKYYKSRKNGTKA
jgi:hypothetical protein